MINESCLSLLEDNDALLWLEANTKELESEILSIEDIGYLAFSEWINKLNLDEVEDYNKRKKDIEKDITENNVTANYCSVPEWSSSNPYKTIITTSTDYINEQQIKNEKMNKPIIIEARVTEQKAYTFNNFYELKGFLKGCKILVDHEDLHDMHEILFLLGFGKGRGGKCCATDIAYIVEISDTDYVYDGISSVLNIEHNFTGKDVINEYRELKAKLLAAIIPWPTPDEYLKRLTLSDLNSLVVMADTIIDKKDYMKMEEKGLWNAFFGEIDIEGYRQLQENYVIQMENLKFLA